MQQTWELWYPDAAAAGLPFARCRVDDAAVQGRLLVHAPPPRLDVIVRDAGDAVLARAEGLERHAQGPMSVLVVDGGAVRLEDRWPDQDDVGRLVILPGGEAGTLLQWWNADDHSEWRWQVEFYNHV